MIVQRYEQALLNYVGRMIRDRETALDVTQEVFLRAYSSLSAYRSEYKFTTWIFRIASNHLIDGWRKKKFATVSLDRPLSGDDDAVPIQVADDKASVIGDLERKELRERLEAAIERLPVRLRELFVWRHVQGLSYEEMAEIRKLPVGTVKNRVFQAKEMMRRMLEETS